MVDARARSRRRTLPEDRAKVAEIDRALVRLEPEVVKHARRYRARCRAAGMTTLRGIGFPLRPLLLARGDLAFLGRAIHERFESLQHALLSARSAEAIADEAPFCRQVFDALDVASGAGSESFLALLRPDGFFYRDRFVLTDVNFGNGAIVSNAYSEVLFEYFRESPVFRALGWNMDELLPRPFVAYASMIARRVQPGDERRFVALLAHSAEYRIILSWPKRVIQQVQHAQRLLRAAGIDSRIVHEDDLWIDARGATRIRRDRRRVDAVILMTIGTSFMEAPDRLRGDLALLRGAFAGRAPIIKPLASLCVDKGTMPYHASLPGWPAKAHNGFQLELAATAYPAPNEIERFRRQRRRYVLKRSFYGKDTLVGAGTTPETWEAGLRQVVATKHYVIQDYWAMPRTRMPVILDDSRLAWVPVQVEVSPFVVDGAYAGAIARYAPEAEGLILSPPPDDMGLTMVASA